MIIFKIDINCKVFKCPTCRTITKKYDDKVVLSSILQVTVPPFALQTEEQVEKGKNVKVGF
jgi:hypothetical protein